MGRIKMKSFTLIELIIAVGVTALILPAVFAIFFSIIKQQIVLVSYQTMKLQGDNVQRNIKNMLLGRAAYVTDSSYSFTTTDSMCPPITTPTPTYAPELYFKDRDDVGVHIYLVPNPTPATNSIASDSAGVTPKTYYLTSPEVSISSLGFTCSQISAFTPPIISVKYTVLKSSVYQSQSISLPYSFKIRLRDY
jgi:type II secretory pathway pseudopilin PulG